MAKGSETENGRYDERVGYKDWQGQWKETQWIVIGFLWLAMLVIGFIGYMKYLIATPGKEYTFFHALYHSLQLFVLEYSAEPGTIIPWELNFARFFSPLVAGYTAVKAFTLLFYETIQHFKLRTYKNHVVICGLGRIGNLLAINWLAEGKKVVIIERDEGNDNIPGAKEHGAIVLVGEATDPLMLSKARVQYAEILVVVTGNDGINSEIAVKSREIKETFSTKPLTCFVHIVELPLFNLLNEHTLMKTPVAGDMFRLSLFNVHSSGAQELHSMKLGFDITEPDPKIVIVGLGQFGQSLLVETVIRWKLFNPNPTNNIRIHIVDRKASAIKGKMFQLYKFLEDHCDITVHDIDVESGPFQKAEFILDEQGKVDTNAVFVSFDDDSLGHSAALFILNQLNTLGAYVPIIVRTNQDKGIATLLPDAASLSDPGTLDKKSNPFAFELFRLTCVPEKLIGFHENLAKAFHDTYLAYIKTLDDGHDTVPFWTDLSESLKLSNRRQAHGLSRVLSMAGFQLTSSGMSGVPVLELSQEEIESIAVFEHQRWHSDQLRDGWVTGEEKDLYNKVHPDLREWTEISDHTRDVTRNWAKSLPSILKEFNYRITRRK